MARVLGFEPRNNRSKVYRLTAWLHPIICLRQNHKHDVIISCYTDFDKILMRNEKQTSPGIAGQFEELNVLLVISPEEEDVRNMELGNC